jgi:hypothetical protein
MLKRDAEGEEVVAAGETSARPNKFKLVDTDDNVYENLDLKLKSSYLNICFL